MTPLPNDGPLMRWLLVHGKKRVPNRDDWKTFDSDLDSFRHARDEGLIRGDIRMNMNIAEIPAELELSEVEGERYKTTLSFMSFILPSNAYVREMVSGNTRMLTAGTDGGIPLSIAEGLVGRSIDHAIALPPVLQPVIAGRIITSYSQFDEWLSFTLDSEPWL